MNGIALAGRHAALEPLSHEHHDALCEAAGDGGLWDLWYANVPKPEAMRADIDRRLALRDEGTMLPFVVRDHASGKVVGATTFLHIDATRRRLEIGATWYARSSQRTAINTECKLLLLAHAFGPMGRMAVELRTSYYNEASRRAIERLGAKQDGILRHHGLHADGSIRDTVVFSIVAPEWPAVKSNLERRLARV